MKIVLFGATGMIGQGVLREALLDDRVTSVLAVGRASSGTRHPKLHDLPHADFRDLSGIERDLAGHDACLFCLGVSSAGMSELDYSTITYDYTIAAARAMLRASPEAAFLYVSGAGTDATERGSSMWARVKGRTENALLAMPFKSAYMLRPGYIQPVHGIVSKTRLYRTAYSLMGPLFPLVKRLVPSQVTTTERLGRAMLRVAREGAARRVLSSRDLDALGD